MKKTNSFYQLFLANFKIMFRNYRGVFFNIGLPVLLYVTVGKVSTFLSAVVPNGTYADYLLPGIIALTILQTGIFSVAYWLIDLRTSGALKRFLVTPMSPIEMIVGVVASRLVLIIVQVSILMAIGAIFFNAKVSGSFLAFIVLLALGGAVFLSIGFLISSVANNYEEAAPITTLTNLSFTFLGNVFFNTTKFPGILKTISDLLPITFVSQGIRNNFLNSDWTFVKTLPDILGLVVWLCLLLAANVATFKSKED